MRSSKQREAVEWMGQDASSLKALRATLIDIEIQIERYQRRMESPNHDYMATVERLAALQELREIYLKEINGKS